MTRSPVTRSVLCAVVAMCLAASVGFHATASAGPALVERSRVSMGSLLTLTAWTADEPGAQAAFDAVFAEFDRLEALMTVWRPTSDVARLNEAAGERAVAVGPETREVLRVALQISDLTGGAFDVTFGALGDLWKFDHDQDNRIPPPEEIRRRLPLVNYRNLELRDDGTAFLKKKGMRVNLGGIGKGYAVDRGAAILRQRGFRDFLIQAGGDLYVSGRHDGRPWRLGIRDPRGPEDRIFASLDLTDGTFSTSGDYERFFMRDGRRYHHIIDLSTGEPARNSRSVTLVTDRAIVADALAKAVFILGPRDGLALIERLPNIEGVIVGAHNEVVVSSGLKGRLVMVAPPTDAP